MNDMQACETPAQPAKTVPDNFPLSVRGFDSESHAMEFGRLLRAYVGEFSRYMDLSQLDGVTVAYDYAQTLLDLDRGYASSQGLAPSAGDTVGIAMTPSVIRAGQVKSHIVLHAGYIRSLENSDDENHGFAVHTLAHECAHVEVTRRFNTSFPGVLLQHSYSDLQENFRWQTILACWDEYAATFISAKYGTPNTVGYEDTFIFALETARSRVSDLIRAYRLHGDVVRILQEVYGAMGNVLKFSAYHLGNLAGIDITWTDMPRTTAALNGHWFRSYFVRLDEACRTIGSSYGCWVDESAFGVIGDLVDELVADAGLYVTKNVDGALYVDIP
jgi:hypothetical protein